MSSEIKEGSVVIVSSTYQAGTLLNEGEQVAVLLRNGDIWIGPPHHIREPQDQADLDGAALEFDRFASR